MSTGFALNSNQIEKALTKFVLPSSLLLICPDLYRVSASVQ
jgi:hypothetical protein